MDSSEKIYENINNIIGESEFNQLNVQNNGGNIEVEHLNEVLPKSSFYVHPTITFINSIKYDNTDYIDLVKYLTEKDNPNNTITTPELKKENLFFNDQTAYQNAYDRVDRAVLFIMSASEEDILYETSEDVANHSTDANNQISGIKNRIITELKKQYPEIKVGTPTGINFSKLYLKISDLDSSKLPAVSTQTPNAEIIPGVNRILRNNRKAIDFTGSNADIKIDYSPKEEETSINISDYYKGGILYTSNETVSLINDNGNFVCRINKEDFKNTDNKKSVLMDIIKAGNANFSQLTIRSSDNNLYGIIKDFYNNYGNKIIPFGSYDTREDVLKDASQETGYKRMFGDDNELNSDISSNQALKDKLSIDADFASFLLKNDVSVKNVVIDETKEWPDSRKSQLGGTLVNSVVKTSMEKVEGLKVKGLVRFEQKSPSAFSNSLDGLTKIILIEYNEGTVYKAGSTYNISELEGKQSDIVTKNLSGYYYLGSDATSLSPSSGQVFIFPDGSYKKNASSAKIYSNKNIERAGNGETVSESEAIQLEGSTGTISNYPLSRANNIKLTPMQRLLLDNQNTIG